MAGCLSAVSKANYHKFCLLEPEHKVIINNKQGLYNGESCYDQGLGRRVPQGEGIFKRDDGVRILGTLRGGKWLGYYHSTDVVGNMIIGERGSCGTSRRTAYYHDGRIENITYQNS